MYMFCSTAVLTIVTISELPPALKNGNGMPVQGDTFIVMPTFTKTWTRRIDDTPTATRLPNISRACWATRRPLLTMKNSTARAATAPKNPSSSATTENMKSV
ncbi:MAG: hypothetical protein BWY85_00948 [Firmicutes bacterium ADurb.Bin506]|nr:MAG: hypothetical protein BWY85_00948 [Firmicutes bacterium ADurb.Bin506]